MSGSRLDKPSVRWAVARTSAREDLCSTCAPHSRRVHRHGPTRADLQGIFSLQGTDFCRREPTGTASLEESSVRFPIGGDPVERALTRPPRKPTTRGRQAAGGCESGTYHRREGGRERERESSVSGKSRARPVPLRVPLSHAWDRTKTRPGDGHFRQIMPANRAKPPRGTCTRS